MNDDLGSHQILQDLSLSLPAAIFIYTLDKYGQDKVRYISDGCYSIWGCSSEDVMHNAQLLWDIIYPDDLELMKNSVQESYDNLSKWECEWRIIPNNSNKIKWLRGFGTPHSNIDGSVVWTSIILDVTKEKEAIIAENNGLKDMINVLVAALEARDPYTAGHGKNVSKVARMIGQKLGLPTEQIEGIYLGGLVHDIGKIITPSEILTKPTKLLDVEYALVQLHPETGAKFFENVNLHCPVREIVEQHHERLDGSGYPKGLKGDEIILEARVIAVADVVDSMATNRPYRFSLGLEKAIQILKEGKGIKFDKDVVDALIDLVNSKELTIYQ